MDGKKNLCRKHAPDRDAHILHVGADGRDLAVHLAGPLASAAGRPLVAELAQLLYLHSRGLCFREGNKRNRVLNLDLSEGEKMIEWKFKSLKNKKV